MLFRKRKTSQVRYFVSIGAGLNQIPLISEAKKLGFHVIGVDANISAPGFYHCDLKIQESIENYDAIYMKLLELLVDGDIHGVMTKSYGPAITTTSYLAGKFNVPFLPFSSAMSFNDKSRMKAVFIDHGIATPQPLPLTPRMKLEKIPASSYPIIIKPKVGHAKINVRMTANIAELRKYCESLDKPDEKFIFEKFITGDEIIAAGIIHDSTYHLVEITDKKTSYPPYFIDMMHTTPSRHQNLAPAITSVGQVVADAFSIVRSPLIMEFVVAGDGQPYLIEAVPEFGGEFLPDVLVPASAGYNIIRESIKSMTNGGFRPPQQLNSKNAVVVRYITGQKGVLASCNPDGPQKVRGTIFSRILKEIGSPINDPVTNLDRIGVVVVSSGTPAEALALSSEAVTNFNIRIK
ncbi:MAG: ATP-grasp domain-containing protein [Spirochaetes bacterium]|nr:ATP-grasp domain-containing protein [Spirochaetota bacterium]